MNFSKTQKDIIKNIAYKKVNNLNSFYSFYFDNYETEKVGLEITGYSNSLSVPKFPGFCTLINTIGINLNEEQISKLLDFLTVWKELERMGLIYSFDFYEKNEEKEEKYHIPLYPEKERFLKGKFNHYAFGLVCDYLTKAIIPTEELRTFTRKYKTFEEIKFIRSLNWTKVLALVSMIGVFTASYFNFKSYELQNQKQNFPDTSKQLKIKPIQNDTIRITQDTFKNNLTK